MMMRAHRSSSRAPTVVRRNDHTLATGALRFSRVKKRGAGAEFAKHSHENQHDFFLSFDGNTKKKTEKRKQTRVDRFDKTRTTNDEGEDAFR